ncbi:DUF4232 domain-containing protein [Streptomyces sp. SID5770]|uniref:DUF4232 domain-containing protein n=1 Tax=Streptomyces sp. SID5770 TaxID=2690308 RepID=UPI00136AA7B3|nr:DUF4232 domain-containing protein [Streptomyces sp. SID5770]MZE52639.1 DUF4232 domain-containing protein [Streptomyces sp. SID5770]
MRRTPLPALALPAACLLLLTACGTERQGAAASATPSTARDCGAGSPTAPGTPDGDEVVVIGTGTGPGADRARPCGTYAVTNRGTEPLTYTVTLGFQDADTGRGLTNVKDTVEAVAPGRTVRRTVTADDATAGVSSDAAGRVTLSVLTVRGVPAAEASSEGGACPPTGVRVYADEGDAAMGLRVVGLHLENCGTRPYRLKGHPRVEPLDEARERVDGVAVLEGGDAIASGTGADGPPEQLVLAPGERARAGLVWRNTVDSGTEGPVAAPYPRVWAKPGAAPVMVIPELDLGTTGKLGVGPWKKEQKR